MSQQITRKTEARIVDRERRRVERERKRRTLHLLGFAIVGVLIALGLGMIFYGATQSSGTPRLQLDRELIDMGDQHFNTTVRATFKLTNAGDGPLTLNAPKVATVVEGC